MQCDAVQSDRRWPNFTGDVLHVSSMSKARAIEVQVKLAP
jgi:hypothetical protein